LVANQPTHEDNWTDFVWDNVDWTSFYWTAWIKNKYFIPLAYWNAIWNNSFSFKIIWKEKIWWWDDVEYLATKVNLEWSKYILRINWNNWNNRVFREWNNFSTKDQDNDTRGGNCVNSYHSPWWMDACHSWTPLWWNRDWHYNTIDWKINEYKHVMFFIK
jgi:hypothetical protein